MENKYMNKEWLTEEYVANKKTSRQISRELKVSRKMINVFLLKFDLIKRSQLEDGDLP
jgi:DNA-binding CsgD family transcriptional regulator